MGKESGSGVRDRVDMRKRDLARENKRRDMNDGGGNFHRPERKRRKKGEG